MSDFPEQRPIKFEPIECIESPERNLLGPGWKTVYKHDCDFDAKGFFEVVHYLVRNPNVNSSNLFRADILYDSDGTEHIESWLGITPEQLKAECPDIETQVSRDRLKRRIIRRFIPRNDGLDRPINQSVLYYGPRDSSADNIVVMIPHVQDASQMPFYHPKVAGLAFNFSTGASTNQISIEFHLFSEDIEQPFPNRLLRTAYHLLKTVWKHGQGNLAGYQKRMHHDQIIPQKRVQDRFADLKRKYSVRLMANWAEVTDPAKQTFEQIGIAAFLLELWTDMYSYKPFPGFVDIGCGNGVLVEILTLEGYSGWGIEGHRRKTWLTLSPKTRRALVHGIVVPAPLDQIAAPDLMEQDFGMSNNPLPKHLDNPVSLGKKFRALSTKLFDESKSRGTASLPPFHNGLFNTTPESCEGPFIISNHADELTGWTPFLALLNRSSFFIVPCCSRNLSGERFRAPSHGNNWTADMSAPHFFHGQQNGRPKSHKKHISINIPVQPHNDCNGEPSPAQDSPCSTSSSITSEPSFLTSRIDVEQRYHFVNAAPLAIPPSITRTVSDSSTIGPPQPNGQAAETGDLKKLSQKARSKGLSGYQALCCWVVHLADKCGYLVEREMLRLPSTRNFGIVGRFMKGDLQFQDHIEDEVVDRTATLRERMVKVLELIESQGGAQRSKWLSVCEKEVVKGNDLVEHAA